jgi:hypothetical protein
VGLQRCYGGVAVLTLLALLALLVLLRVVMVTVIVTVMVMARVMIPPLPLVLSSYGVLCHLPCPLP